MTNDVILPPNRKPTRRQELLQAEAEVFACNKIVDEFIAWRDALTDEFTKKAEAAFTAIQRRDELLAKIDTERLWESDYTSAEEYFDDKGFSRQRLHQLRVTVRWRTLIGAFTKLLPVSINLPIPTDHHARELGMMDEDKGIAAWRYGVTESGGNAPSIEKTREAVAMVNDDVPLEDKSAIAIWKDRKRLDIIRANYMALQTVEARREAAKILRGDWQ